MPLKGSTKIRKYGVLQGFWVAYITKIIHKNTADKPLLFRDNDIFEALFPLFSQKQKTDEKNSTIKPCNGTNAC